MNYLELFQRVSQECAIPGPPPSSVVGQTGILLKLKTWVNQAYEDIQRQYPNWMFMQKDKTFTTIAGVNEYISEMSDVVEIKQDSVILDRDIVLTHMHYDHFKQQYQVGNQSDSQPQHYTISNSKSLLLGPVPNDTYSITFQYTQTIQSLTNNTDIPILPADHHLAIVWLACSFYAAHEESDAQLQIFSAYFKSVMARLTDDQKKPVLFCTEAMV